MPIGGVLATKGVVIPNAVGVDIGCGMCSLKSNIRVETITPDILRKQIMRGIRRQIPVGREHYKQRQDKNYMPQG
jgi:tRNA-splicing ligase RtcB